MVVVVVNIKSSITSELLGEMMTPAFVANQLLQENYICVHFRM